jgi:hypothetical protein
MSNAGNGRVHTYIHRIQEFIDTLSYHVGALVGAEQINDPLNCDLTRPSGYGAIAPNRRVYPGPEFRDLKEKAGDSLVVVSTLPRTQKTSVVPFGTAKFNWSRVFFLTYFSSHKSQH